jgi:hypothetical protein
MPFGYVIRSRHIHALMAGCAILASPIAASETIPSNAATLIVTGKIGQATGSTEIVLDIAALERLPSVSFDTTTIWTDGSHRYTGVPVKALLQSLDAVGETVTATALNDYSVKIPVSSLTDSAPIIAYKVDGKLLPRREKGPFWIVYPYDADSAYRTDLIASRSIWQLLSLSIDD